MAAVDADQDLSTFVPPTAPKKRGGRGSRVDAVREQIVDIEHAIRALATARTEMAEVPHGLSRREREVAMVEPMGRLQLVVKFCEDVLRRNGWKRVEVK